MATWTDVRRLAEAFPSVRETAPNEWRVGKKMIIRERPLRRGDLEALGDAAPTGPVLVVGVADEGVKQALIADDPAAFFTTPHFDGYAAVLIRLDGIGEAALAEVIEEAWVRQAPKTLVRDYLRTAD
jgi:hypothetical protein